jgi:hypothetical protein
MSGSHSHSRSHNAPGVSFSWSRAIGLSALKGKISRETGIPLTRSGREKKIGHLVVHSLGAVFWLAVAGVIYFATTHPEIVKQITAALRHS